MKHRNTLSSHVSCFFHTKMFDFIYGASFRPRNLVGNVWQERRAVLEGIWGERIAETPLVHIFRLFYPKIYKFIEGASFRPRNLVGNVWQERRAVLRSGHFNAQSLKEFGGKNHRNNLSSYVSSFLSKNILFHRRCFV